MKNINVCLLAAVACTYSIQVSANSLEHNLNFVIEDNVFSLHSSSAASHTVTPLELKPMLISNSGVKLAAVCALGSGGCDGLGFGTGNNDINLDTNAQCRDEGFGNSCPSGYVPDTSQKCPYNNSFFKCRVCSHSCNSGSLTTCNSSQVETGSSRNDCNETCYTCRAKTCEEGGYASSITSCQKANAVSFAGKTCYSGVSAKTCADGGYSASVPTNSTCSSTSYCSNSCYHSCRQPSCSEGGYVNACPSGQVGTTVSYYGQTCYTGCYTPCTNTCNSGYSFSSCNANQVQTNAYSNDCGNNCYQCRAKTCADGGYANSCPSGQVGTAVSYATLTCYSGCYNPDCNATSQTCAAGCKTNNSCGKCIECNTDTASVCTGKGYSNTAYCSSSSGYNTEYCPENSAYKKCIFSCATYKSSVMSQIEQFEDQAKNSYADACGKWCMNKPIWPIEYCESVKRDIDNLLGEYRSKCGEWLSVFVSCPHTSCRDGMLGIDMCENYDWGM